MLSKEIKAAIRKIIIDGQEDELLTCLRELKDLKNPARANDIALATLEAFTAMKSDEWNIAHLTKLNIFGEFALDELEIRIDLILYVLDPVMLNCVRLCNDFYKDELTEQQARGRLEFVRQVKQTFHDRIKTDGVLKDGLDNIETNFESILNALTHEKPTLSQSDKAWGDAFLAIHSVIFTCYYRNERISPEVYDGLVLLLNFFRSNHKDTIFSLHSNSANQMNCAFEKFLSGLGFYLDGNIRNQTDLSHHLRRGLIAVDDVMRLFSCYQEPKEKQKADIFKNLFSKPKMSPLENLKQHCELLKPEIQWINTRQLFDIVLLTFKIKDVGDQNYEAIYKSLELILDRPKDTYANDVSLLGKGSIALCHLFYQHGQLTYDIFCQVFCNKLELGSNASHLWEQLNLKFSDADQAKFSKKQVFSAAFSDDSAAQRLVALMLPVNFEHERRKVSADEVLVTLWLDHHFKIFNHNLSEIIFHLNVNQSITSRYRYGYAEKIFQFSAYLLLMLHLHYRNDEINVNPALIASFLNDDWITWRKTLCEAIKCLPTSIIPFYFFNYPKIDFDTQLKKLVLATQLKWASGYGEISAENFKMEKASEFHELCLLSELNLSQLKNVIEAMKPITSKYSEYMFILEFTISLVKRAYPISAISHHINKHIEISPADVLIEEKKRTTFLSNSKKEFRQHFVLLTDAKNAILLLLEWNAKMTSVIPLDIIVYLVNFLFPADLSFTPRELALSLRGRENFLKMLKESNGLGDGVGACYAAIRSQYPILEDSSTYKASITQLIKTGLFNQENIQKLHTESTHGSSDACKKIYK
jgi:hypothetical protein